MFIMVFKRLALKGLEYERYTRTRRQDNVDKNMLYFSAGIWFNLLF